ncbi:MAG: carboxylesterase/lipase family protein [Chloroflexota bacterium]|nr:carboxylesterase/lipase family protein [Chloroflexota bacterium]
MGVRVDEVVVGVREGRLRGRLQGGVASFKGVPFAAPPVGANRMRPPQPASSWHGVRDVLEYGPTVPKAPYMPPFDQILPEPAIPGDDCLNLNVWTPEPAGGGLPVMVWIHGGAFTNGSGAVPTYDGTAFARDGVVCVTINYRLGPDGFLDLADGPANLGLVDQVAALSWMRENAAAFGGDPSQITIFGESAGAMSVATLLAMPSAEGLFRRVIAQSGAGHHAISRATAQVVTRAMAERLGVEPSLAGIAGVAPERLAAAQLELSAEIFAAPDPGRWGEVAANLMPFEPVIDGRVLPDLPIRRIAAGAGAGVDVMIGTNTEEERLFMVPNGVVDIVDQSMLEATAAGFGLPSGALDTYRAARPGASPGDLLCAVITDWFFRIPAVRLAEAHAASGAGNFVYEFAWQSPEGRLGACHALEVAFAFDTLRSEGAEKLVGPNPPQALADEMHRAWVAFATTGDPGWPMYDPGRRAVMRFDVPSQVVDDPAGEERRLWEGIR